MKYLLYIILSLSLFSCKKSPEKIEKDSPSFKPIILAFFPKETEESPQENQSSSKNQSCVCVVVDPSAASALDSCSCLPEAYNEEAFLNILQEMRVNFDKAADKEDNTGMQAAVETARKKIENLFNQQTKDLSATANQEEQPTAKPDNSCFCVVIDHPDITAWHRCSCEVGIRNYKALNQILEDLNREFFDEENQKDKAKLSAINEKYRKKVDELWLKEREGQTQNAD